MNHKFNYIEHYKKDAEEFNYFEERTGASEHDERRVREFVLSRVNNYPRTILDVGAGSAWVAKNYQYSDTMVFSLDISKTNVKKAKNIAQAETHVPIVADSFNLPFFNNTFDIVIASEVIEHVIDPANFVEELLRVVKNGGKLIVTTPYKEILRYYLCIHCNQKTPVHAHIHSFDEKSLTLLSSGKSHWITFGNKLLIFLRTYVLLKYFPFKFWRLVDKLFNKIKNIPVHILVEYYK